MTSRLEATSSYTTTHTPLPIQMNLHRLCFMAFSHDNLPLWWPAIGPRPSPVTRISDMSIASKHAICLAGSLAPPKPRAIFPKLDEFIGDSDGHVLAIGGRRKR